VLAALVRCPYERRGIEEKVKHKKGRGRAHQLRASTTHPGNLAPTAGGEGSTATGGNKADLEKEEGRRTPDQRDSRTRRTKSP